jgi:beta-xylosidase
LKYKNPVYPSYFADPFVWLHDGIYYAVGTTVAESEGRVDEVCEAQIFPLLRSPDLVNWTRLGNALIRPDRELGDTFWAPEVAFHDGVFFMYYSVGLEDKGHQLRVATSLKPEGPYLDVGRSLVDKEKCPFAIDAHPFQDDDGQWYLFYARDFLDTDDDTRAGTALVMDRLVSMTELAGEEIVVLRARSDWQLFQANRQMYGGCFDWHTLEGPSVRKRNGRYYCLYSGGCWENETYGVDFAVADKVTGPYTDAGNESGSRVLRTVKDSVLGPGHNSIVLGPDGQTDYIVYHAWDVARKSRRMCIDKLRWTDAGPGCAGPTTDEQFIRTDRSLAEV